MRFGAIKSFAVWGGVCWRASPVDVLCVPTMVTCCEQRQHPRIRSRGRSSGTVSGSNDSISKLGNSKQERLQSFVTLVVRRMGLSVVLLATWRRSPQVARAASFICPTSIAFRPSAQRYPNTLERALEHAEIRHATTRQSATHFSSSALQQRRRKDETTNDVDEFAASGVDQVVSNATSTMLLVPPPSPRKARGRPARVAVAAPSSEGSNLVQGMGTADTALLTATADGATATTVTTITTVKVKAPSKKQPKASTPPFYPTSSKKATKKTKIVATTSDVVTLGDNDAFSSEAGTSNSVATAAVATKAPSARKKKTSASDAVPASRSIATTADAAAAVVVTKSKKSKQNSAEVVEVTDEISTSEREESTSPPLSAPSELFLSVEVAKQHVEDGVLIQPFDLVEPDKATGLRRLPYPKALSPSSIKEFQACPQSFLFQYILGLRQPTTPVLAKGSMCHAALERVFDLDPAERSLPVLQNLFRTAWSEHRLTDVYRSLFEIDDEGASTVGPSDVKSEGELVTAIAGSESEQSPEETTERPPRRRDLEREAAWGREGLQLLENYWKVENAAQVLRPNPVHREMWVRAPLLVDPLARQSAAASDSTSLDGGTSDGQLTTDANTTALQNDMPTNETTDPNTFLVRGIIDRLDMVQDPSNKSSISLRLIDYKSGKAPDLKYSAPMNAKIQREAFEQLLIYALLHRETGLRKDNPMPLRYLRLFYLTSVVPTEAVYWDLDLGATPEERDAVLRPVYENVAAVWTSICQLIDKQDPTVFTGCQRSFCYCHTCRNRFVPESVWQPPVSQR